MHTADKLVRCGAVLCPLCHGLLVVHGSYPRHCRDENGGRHDGWVAQGRCMACNVYPSLIPKFLMPHKHFKAEVIEAVVAASEWGNVIEHIGGCAADVSTMRRWSRQFRERGTRAVGQMASTLLTVCGVQASPLKLQELTLLEQLARLLREYPVPGSGGVIGRANIVLTTRNCGFL